MATATRKNNVPPVPPSPGAKDATKPSDFFLIRAFDATFRFLASVKLAVFCLASLATTLAFGTRFNSWYGMAAANEWIYQTRWFALLLAFLAINILCAALIRFPWTRRQTGFVITHVGLLITIGGSYWASQTSDEGQVAMKEGDTTRELIRLNRPAFFIRAIDPHTGKPLTKYELPFYPGTFDWPEGRFEVVSKPKDPFKLAVKKFYMAAEPKTLFVEDSSGSPMARIRPKVKPPRADAFIDALSGEEQWFVVESRRFPRSFKKIPRAQLSFEYNEDHQVWDDFVNPPADAGQKGIARLRYPDHAGKPRVFDVKLDDARPGVPIPLPDSDLTASLVEVEKRQDPGLRELIGQDELNIVQFNVRKGSGSELLHRGFASLPMIPATVSPETKKDEEPPTPLLDIDYYLPPVVAGEANGLFDVIEVMGNDHGQLAYRVYIRGNGTAPGKLGPHGLLKTGEEINVTASDPQAMTLKFSVDQFFQTGVKKEVFDSITDKMPPSQKDDGLAAVQAEFTVGGVTKDLWLMRSPGFEQNYTTVTFPDAMYEIAFDVDRLDLGFSLTLDDFDVGFDPGTNTPSSFRSEVRLTDEAEHLKDKPVSIYMNHTLDHRGWRFFQSSYRPYLDPKTMRRTGEFVSVFQVARNPAREMIYAGCIIVCLGAFVQFYMRAGLFTDGGKREQERAAEKARRRLAAKLGKSEGTAFEVDEDDAEKL